MTTKHYGHEEGLWFYGCDACNPVDMESNSSYMEWGIFRKGDASSVVPAENLTYTTREQAERVIKRSYLHPKMWEARGRVVGPWDAKAKDARQT